MVDGHPLPVCQRCLGLYIGALLTLAWLAATGIWRRGLPTRSIFLAQAAALLLAMLGGLHVLDPGPSWRVACGLWTGHIAILWLAGGSVCLWKSHATVDSAQQWRRGEQAQAIAMPAALGILAAGSGLIPLLSWFFWAAMALAGAAGLAVLLVAAVAFMGLAILRRVIAFQHQ